MVYIMKTKHLITIIMILVCLNVFGQQKNTVPMTVQSQKTEVQVLEETILQLQAENQVMQKQMESIEKDVELYRADLRAIASDLTGKMSHWLTVLSILIGAIVTILGAGLGIVVPLILNNKSEKRINEKIDEIKQEVAFAKTYKMQAESSEEKANEYSITAEEATKEIDNIIKINQLYIKASAEKDKIKAIGYINQAIKLDPDDAFAYYFRASMKDDLGDKEGAVADYDKAILLNPDYAEAYNNRGFTKEDLGNKMGALADYNKAILIRDDYEVAYNNRGYLKSSLGDINGAFEDFNIAISLKPDYPNPYNHRGMLKLKIGDLDGAIDDINRAILLDPNYADAYYSRAQYYRKLAETEEDPTKKAELIAKAEADEEKAKSLGDK